MKMENKEDILQSLEAFAKNRTEKIPSMLEHYLISIANTGETLFPWGKVKPLIIFKLEREMKNFSEKLNEDEYDQVPSHDVIACKEMQARVLHTLNAFKSAPFTIQRISELILYPFKHYRKMNKWLRGIEKNVNVVSSVDPFGNKIVCEPKEMVNGMDHAAENGYQNENLRTPMIQSPFTPPGPPPSAQGSPGISLQWRDSSPWPSSPLVWGNNEPNQLSDYQNNIVSSNLVSPLEMCDNNEAEEEEDNSSEPLQKRLKFDDCKESETLLNCSENQTCLSPSNVNTEWSNTSSEEKIEKLSDNSLESDQLNIHSTSNDVPSFSQCTSNMNLDNQSCNSQIIMHDIQNEPSSSMESTGSSESTDNDAMELDDTCTGSISTNCAEENDTSRDEIDSSQVSPPSVEISSSEESTNSHEAVSSSISEECEQNFLAKTEIISDSIDALDNIVDMKTDDTVSSSDTEIEKNCNVNCAQTPENFVESDQNFTDTSAEDTLIDKTVVSTTETISLNDKEDEENSNYELSSL